MAEEQKETQTQKPAPSASGKNNTLLIIIILVMAVILLGVGGYFGWRYYKSKISSQASTKTSPSPVVTVTVTASVLPTATPSLSSSKAISGDYVIADSDTRAISESELYNLTPWQLKVARNEIYARHGRPFVHKDLQCYFATKSWYHGNPNYSDSLLTSVDNKNVATILAYEESINSPLLQKDTGC